MTLIVEDGAAMANSEAYATVEFADAYHEARGNTSWDAVDDKEAALRKATDYMVGKYREQWAGVRKTITQALDWPRDLVPVKDGPNSYVIYYANDMVPLQVQQACAILALKTASSDLITDLTQAVASVTVGPISTAYDNTSSRQTEFTEIDRLVRPYLRTGKGSIKMVRN